MMVAYRFRWLGWFLLCVGVVLGCYMVSLQVAGERKHLDDVNRQIASTQRSIRALETEFDTRASLAQLEAWNGDTLKLSAPVAQQFLANGAALAQVDFDGGRPPGGGKVLMAAAVIPTAPVIVVPVPAALPPTVRVAATIPVMSSTATSVAAVGRPAAAPRETRPVRTAQVERTGPAADHRTIQSIRAAATDAVRTATPRLAMLLSDTTLGDLVATAKAEKRK